MQNRLDPLLYEHCGCGHGTKMGPRTGPVGDIDRIGKALQGEGLIQEFGTVRGHRRGHFRGDYKSLGAQLVF